MIEAGTFRRGVSYSETVDGRVYAIRILPVRRLDGSKARALTWEIAMRRPKTVYLACGTAGSEEEAKAVVASIIRNT